MKVTFDISATRAFAALSLKRFVQGPIALLICLVTIMPFLLQDFRNHNFIHVGVAVALLLFVFVIVRDFILEKLENDNQQPLSKTNAACLVSFDILRHLVKRKPTSSFSVLEAAVTSDRGKFILHEMGIEGERFLALSKSFAEKIAPLDFLTLSTEAMEHLKVRKIDAGCILYTFFQQSGISEKIMNELDISIRDLSMIVQWEQFHHRVWHKNGIFSPARLVRTFGGIGRKWVMGFNDALGAITDEISQDILYQGKRSVTIHLKELQNAIHVLNRSALHNVIITGDHGCGKSTFIENIAYHLRKNESSHGLAYTRVLVLKAQDLLSGSENPDTFLLQALARANKQGRFILVIEDIGLFLQAGNTNVRSVLIKFLKAENIHVIGVAHTRDYHALIKTDPSLDAQFEKISLEPTSFSDTMSVLMEEYFEIEDRVHVHVTYKALRSIVELADQYISKGAFPGKAIDLLRDAVMVARNAKEDYVTQEHISRVVSVKANMDVGRVNNSEKEVLLHLAENMSKHIVGQRNAIDVITNALKRARSNLSTRKRPIGTFLFLGPTGVGKTQTAKVLAKQYYGKEGNMIRLNMNEFSNEDSTVGIVGSANPKSASGGYITQQVQDKPFSLLLLDEIEKAHPKVLNLFLQVLDEGEMIDAQGQRTDFRNTIIIATSNAGAQYIRDFISAHPDPDRKEFKKSLVDHILKEGTYSPEFLNRFDDVVLYYPLSKDETVQVATLMINSVIADVERSKGVAIKIEDDAVAAIAAKGHSAEFGAREMRRAITDTLENYVADYLLKNEVNRGDEIYIKKSDLLLS